MDGIDISFVSTDGINKVKNVKKKVINIPNRTNKYKKINITNISQKTINSHNVNSYKFNYQSI